MLTSKKLPLSKREILQLKECSNYGWLSNILPVLKKLYGFRDLHMKIIIELY